MRASIKKTGIVVVICVVLASCGGGGGDPAPVAAAPQVPPDTVVPSALDPVVPPLTTDPLIGACDIQRGTSASPVYAETHPKVLLNSASTLACLRQALAADTSGTSAAGRFKAYVDNEMAHPGSTYGFEAWHAALMYQVTGTARYADFAVAKVEAAVSSEEALIAAGQRATVAGDSYLYVGEMVGDVALVYDWCHSRLSTAQRNRWVAYMNQAIGNVWNPATASWGGKAFPWSGWSVDNPSNNYYYSFLRATMLVGLATRGENTQAPAWLAQFRDAKIGQELVPTFNRDLAGGGSREGTGYGTAMKNLFQLYDWWERSTGERLATLTPHTLSSMAWMMHNVVPTLDFLAATGDHARESSAALFDYHREYLLSLISLFPQERLSTAAVALLDTSSVPQMQYGFERVVDYLYQPPGASAASTSALTDLNGTYWAPGTGELMMRSRWGDRTAAYSTLMCGPYTESHAHRDQGSFQLYRGEWLAPTSNIYTHSGIQQGEPLNNLVRIVQNGSTITQNWDSRCTLQALADNDVYTYGLAQITPVYSGKSAVTRMEREYLFIKPGTFVVFDRAGSISGTQRVWTLNLPGTPTVNGDLLTYVGAKGNRLEVRRVAPTGLSYQVGAPEIDGSETWSQPARQVNVMDTAGTQSQFLHVLGTNGSVTAATRSDGPGQTGVVITLNDGRTATVRFAQTGTGGTLEVRTAGGAALTSGPLPTTVTPPGLFRD